MAEIMFLVYAMVGIMLGIWLASHGPVKPDNMLRVSALLCIVLLWPFFVLHTLKS